MLLTRRLGSLLLVGALTSTSCASAPAEPQSSVASVSIPPAPSSTVDAATTPAPPVRRKRFDDGTYTVWGASSAFKSPTERAEVDGKQITVEGYIVGTNLAEVPRCAVHETGVADPEDCRAPLPELWIADSPSAPAAEAIRVLGWASNWANVFDAIRKQRAAQPEDHVDAIWGVTLPSPLPAHGAKVRVVGTYGTKFLLSTSGIVEDPNGLLTYKSLETLEAAAEPAKLPGM